MTEQSETQAPTREPAKAIIQLQEIPGKPGAFTIGLALASQHPGADPEAATPVVDVVALVIADILKTTPRAFTDRLKALQDRMTQVAKEIEGGADPRAAGSVLGLPLIEQVAADGE